MKYRLSLLLLVLAMLLPLALPAAAQEGEAIPIHTAEELLAVKDNPGADYILMADLDMKGITWNSPDFSGTFDGNGHSILNLTISQPGMEKNKSWDGNKNGYDTDFFGMFATLQGAQVKNLTLLNVRAQIDWDAPVFLGAIAGYAQDSRIENCSVSGILELRAHDRIFGIGGLVGYGSGRVDKCKVDVTLINTDTGVDTKDEQYLGGIYAAGFMDVYDCQVVLAGFISDHGYVHSGGIVGIYAEYPLGEGKKGYIKRNQVSGKITFFEDNNKRRAYCEPYVGEALVNRWYPDGNTQDFTRDERKEYDVELRPEMCPEPLYTVEIIEPDCDALGYTRLTCRSCGYSYIDSYSLPAHRVTQWTLVKEPTLEEEGLSTGVCSCGLDQTRVEPKLEPEPTTVPTEEAPAAQAPQPSEPGRKPMEMDSTLILLLTAEAVLIALAAILIRALRNKRK